MQTFLTTLHVLAAVSLIITVLLQRGKGSDMGAMLGGGGSQTVFGARGAGNFLTKLTTGCAIIFMVTSLSLAYSATKASQATIFDGPAAEETAAGSALDGDADAASGDLEEVGEVPAGALEEIEDASAGTPEAAASDAASDDLPTTP